MEAIRGSAPGKSMGQGGYSVLNPKNSGYPLTMDTHAHATVIPLPNSNEIRITAPQFNRDVIGTINLNDGRISFPNPEELKLVLIASELTLRYMSARKVKIKGIHLTTENDPAFNYRITQFGGEKKVAKSGLGSSAAITVATVGSILHTFMPELATKDRIHKLAQVAHAIATEKVGSGFDIAAATFGSIQYQRFPAHIVSAFDRESPNEKLITLINSSNWNYTAIPTKLPESITTRTADFTGQGMNTVQSVKNVSRFREAEPEEYARIIDKIERGTLGVLSVVRRINNSKRMSDIDFSALKEAITFARDGARQLGQRSGDPVVPEECLELNARVEKEGGLGVVAPGAGGYDNLLALFRTDKPNSISSFERVITSRNDLELKMGGSEGDRPLDVINSGFVVSKIKITN